MPFFGAAASAVYRPKDRKWSLGEPFMPFGGELASFLANAASYTATNVLVAAALDEFQKSITDLSVTHRNLPTKEIMSAAEGILNRHIGGPPSLALIASWAEYVQGTRRHVDRKLRAVFAVDGVPGQLHLDLAMIDQTQLYVTTNYDDILEKALAPREPHVIVDRGGNGLWVSVSGTEFQPVDPTGSKLYELLNNPTTQQPSQPIILKIHGSANKKDARSDSYLISEEDYVDFLGRAGGNYLPPYINGLLQGKDFLFLGYSLADWNIRVILRKLVSQVGLGKAKSWAIVRGRSNIEQEIWRSQSLNIYPMDLQEFATQLKVHL